MLQYPIIANRYWNANGIGVAVAAVAGEDDDWAAYISAQPDPISEIDATEFASRHGCKLTKTEASAMFPGLAERLVYRDY